MLDEIQENLYQMALSYVKDNSKVVNSVDEMVKMVANRHVTIACHCGDIACEQALKDETGIQSRVIIEDCHNDEKCVRCGKKAKYKAYFAKQY